MKNKLDSRERFRIFKKEARYWIAKLGLVSWYILFEFSNDFSDSWDEDAKAMFVWNLQAKSTILWLNEDWDEDVTEEDICKTAYHEVYELFLVSLRCLAQGAHIATGQVEKEVHSIIRVMENTQFTDDYSKRQVSEKNRRK